MPLINLPNGLAVNAIRTGPRNGTPIIFLHAVGLDLTWWDRQFAHFGTDRDLIAFDMPNHGLSGRLDQLPTFERLAAVTADVLVHLGVSSAHVVGISVGGMIAQTLAMSRPELVQSLTLVATTCEFSEDVREVLRERARTARRDGMKTIARLTQQRWFPAHFRDQRPDILDRAEKALLLQDPEFHASMWDMISALDMGERLIGIRSPALILAGSEDVNAPPSASQRIAGMLPAARLHVFDGVGHLPPVEAPEQFNLTLGSFISEGEKELHGR